MGIRINEFKVWNYQMWGQTFAKLDGDTPGAQFGHEAAENDAKWKNH